MRVLAACECSGRVKTAFRERGHDAWSCNIKPSEMPNDKFHIQDDVLKHLKDGWDLMIAHPPCTRLANSGVRWLEERNLWLDMWEGAWFFRDLLESVIPKIAIENPIPHKYSLEIIGKKYDQLIHPHYFGDKESKATCLWLKGLSPLRRTHWIPKEQIKQSTWKEPPSPERASIRSLTFQGIANAMAEQWGKLDA